MPGQTDNIGTVAALSGIADHENTLDFKKKYPGMHVVIVSKASMMRNGQTTQYKYFKSMGLEELEQLPHPDKVLMGEPEAQFKNRKQVALDRDAAQRNAYNSAGVKAEKSDTVTTVTTTHETLTRHSED